MLERAERGSGAVATLKSMSTSGSWAKGTNNIVEGNGSGALDYGANKLGEYEIPTVPDSSR